MNSSSVVEIIPVCQTVVFPEYEINKCSPEESPDGVGRIYRASGNLLIIKDCSKTTPKQFVGSVRSTVTGFSPRSGVRMRRYLRECLPEYREMVTLTYPGFFETNGKAVKEHLRRFLQELRREYIRQHSDDGRHSSFWFLEFQSRGAPHFHIFTTWSPNKEWVASTWYRIVNSEDIRHLHAGTRVEFLKQGRAGTISYASKYAAKAEQKEVPENYKNVGRFWGVYGWRACLSASTWVSAKESVLPDVEHHQQKLFKMIQRALFESAAEIVHAEPGTRVLTMHDKKLQQNVRRHISMLSLIVSRFDNFLDDAELDYGEGKPCPSFA